jgi:hypothetical protein
MSQPPITLVHIPPTKKKPATKRALLILALVLACLALWAAP